jgi:N-acetylglucosaminyldiphosphoundecaprenol N-acetyl-beta-D-mannosaminyltransferase
MSTTPFPRVNVLGVGVHAINMPEAVNFLLDNAQQRRRKGYVCVTGVHGIMEAQKNCRFRQTLNDSLLTTPDGMPTVWIGKLGGHKEMDRVFGPDLMMNLCRESCARGLTHFLYGGAPGVAEELKRALEARYPGIKVVGTYTPPFRPLSMQEHFDLLRQVNELKPDIIWVGLSTPKQERFMAEYISKFDCTLMLGVGAAFDLHTGRATDSPEWVKRSGLQWAHRLLQEPRRLWRRYLINNPKFLVAITAQLLGWRDYTLPSTTATIPDTERAA